MKKNIIIFLTIVQFLFFSITVNINAMSEINKENLILENDDIYSTSTAIYVDELSQNTVYGPWDNSYNKYNCYAFALDRHELPNNQVYGEEINNFYNVEYMYEVGTFSNQLEYAYQNKSEVNIISNIVIDDLKCLGAINPRKADSIEKLNLNEDDNLICVRTSQYDYHFMKYAREEGCWLHKPGTTHILKWKYNSPSSDNWEKESVKENGLIISEVDSSYAYASEIVYIAFRYEKVSLNCQSDKDINLSIVDPEDIKNEFNEQIDTENDRMIQVNITCSGTYTFEAFSDYAIDFNVYDEKMIEVYPSFYLSAVPDNKCKEYDLYVGTYYLLVNFLDKSDNGNIMINLKGNNYCDELFLEVENDILYNYHLKSDNNCEAYFYFECEEAGVYKFQINGSYTNGLPINFNESEYEILNDQLYSIEKFYNGNLVYGSFNYSSEDYILVYLENNTKYYFKYSLNISNIDCLTLQINKLDISNIDLYNYNDLNSNLSLLDEETSSNVFNIYYLMQQGSFELDFYGEYINNLNLAICEIIDGAYLNDYFISTIIYLDEHDLNTKPIINLNKGLYYLYIYCDGSNKSYDLSLNRLVSTWNQDILITDPSFNDLCGSQINIKEKEDDIYNRSYRSNEITQGFSRIIYLSTGDSRYNYDWYSSDEEIAIVTNHGTVLGLSEGDVTIMAIDKNNFDIVYIKQFEVLSDDSSIAKTIRIYDEIEYDETPYLLKLNAQNCPFPKITYYNWSISILSEETTSFNYHINQWGYVSVSKTCEICIIGRYLYNGNYTILYFLSVE